MIKLLLLFIIINFLILIIPYRKLNVLKKILCSITLALAVSLGMVNIVTEFINDKSKQYDNISITATGEKNEKSEGTEVWIKGAVIDGKWYEADEIFENKWISKDNCLLGWREYDQPTDLNNTIKGKIPQGKKRELVFEGNKWRGKAIVKIENKTEEIDSFIDKENGEDVSKELVASEINENKVLNNQQKNNIFIVIFVAIFSISLLLYYIDSKKKTSENIIKDSNEREVWADLLRIISAFMVVYLHSTCNIYNNFTDNMQIWYKYLYINCFTTFAVPCFFMLSGAFLIRKEVSLKKLLRKQVVNLFISLFAWSIIYILYSKYGLHSDISIKKSILLIPFRSQYSHLWFMYPLIGFYFMSPIISYFYYNLNKKMKLYAIVVIGLIPSIISTVNIMFGWSIDMPWFAIGFPEMLLFILGKYIYDNKKNIFGKEKLCAVAVLMGYSLTVVSSYYISIKNGTPQKDFFQYSRIPVIIFSVSIFMFFVSLEPWLQNRKKKVKKIISEVASLTMGIYFSHVIIKEFLGNKLWLFTDNSGRNITMLLGAILYFTVSVMVCFIIANIPYINKIVCNKHNNVIW